MTHDIKVSHDRPMTWQNDNVSRDLMVSGQNPPNWPYYIKLRFRFVEIGVEKNAGRGQLQLKFSLRNWIDYEYIISIFVFLIILKMSLNIIWYNWYFHLNTPMLVRSRQFYPLSSPHQKISTHNPAAISCPELVTGF